VVTTNPGFAPRNVVASVVLPAPARYPDPAKRALFYRRILDAVRTIPGVEGSGTTDALPFSGENHGGAVYSVATSATPLTSEIDTTGGDYLQTMGIRLLEGRWFREEDAAPSNNSAIVSSSVAAHLWPGSSALGQRICVFCSSGNFNNWKQVVGVVTDAVHSGLDAPAISNVYLSADAMKLSVFLVVRTSRP